MQNVDKKIVMSVVAGIAVFGAIYWATRQLPTGNAITDTVKKVADVAASG